MITLRNLRPIITLNSLRKCLPKSVIFNITPALPCSGATHKRRKLFCQSCSQIFVVEQLPIYTFPNYVLLVKGKKFFITFHKLRLFIRDHNFVLCIFFISFSISARLSFWHFHHPFPFFSEEEIETLLLFCIIFLCRAIRREGDRKGAELSRAAGGKSECIQLKLRWQEGRRSGPGCGETEERMMSTPCQEEMSLRLCGKAN